VQTYHLRGTVRDVGKVLAIPPETLDAIAKRVRQHLDDSLLQSVTAVVGAEVARASRWAWLIALCGQLVGTPRDLGIHNGGYLRYEWLPSTTYTSRRIAARSARLRSVNWSAMPS
jgi:error-prone DNA polymerase